MLQDKKVFFVKEHVDILKLTGTYDILDAEANVQIGVAKEEPGALIKFSRLLLSKQLLPNKINMYDAENNSLIFSIAKPFTWFRSNVKIYNGNNKYLGYFKGKILTMGGGFWVFDANDNQIAEIKGDWKGWNFKFIDSSQNEIGAVTKKWAGLGKELFTSADNYVISINEAFETNELTATLLLAAGLAIDTVFKEYK